MIETLVLATAILASSVLQSYFASRDNNKTRQLMVDQQNQAMNARMQDIKKDVDRAFQLGYQQAMNDLGMIATSQQPGNN